MHPFKNRTGMSCQVVDINFVFMKCSCCMVSYGVDVCGVMWLVCGVVWCHVVLCGFMIPCGTVWCHVVLCGFMMPCGTVWCHLMSCGVVWNLERTQLVV